MARKKRSDAGSKRTTYSANIDNTGKVGRENVALKSFWKKYKMVDIIQLTPEEIDKKIDEWLVEYEARQIKLDKFWCYPELVYEPIKKPKGPKKINNQWNTSFRRK